MDTQPHNTVCLEEVRQEAGGTPRVQSEIAIPVSSDWGVSPAQKLPVRAGSRGFCSFHLKSAPALGSPTRPVPYLHATPKCLSPFFAPRLPKPGTWQRQRPNKVMSQLPSAARDPRRAVPQTCGQDGRFACACTQTGFLPQMSGEERGECRHPGGHPPPTTAPSEHSCSGACPGGQQDQPEQGREDKAGPMQSRSLWPRAPAFLEVGGLAFAWPTWGYTQAEGLTGPQLLLGSKQKRPRCVCRPEVKQMTFIGKAIFFPQCLSVRRID